MQKTWQNIWENKTTTLSNPQDTQTTLQELLIANGFDSKSSTSFSTQSYQEFIQRLFGWAKLEDCESLYEVGCGAGAFLYAMSLQKAQNGGGG